MIQFEQIYVGVLCIVNHVDFYTFCYEEYPIDFYFGRDYCINFYNGNLASILSATENESLKTLLGTVQTYKISDTDLDAWIGLYDATSSEHKRNWIWLSTRDNPNYTQWESGQPNEDDAQCVYLKRSGNWNDLACEEGILCFACNSPLDSYNDQYLNARNDDNYSIFNISIIVTGDSPNTGSHDIFYFGIIGSKYDTITYELDPESLDTNTLDIESYWIEYQGFYEGNSSYSIYPKIPHNIGNISKLIMIPGKYSEDSVKVDKIIVDSMEGDVRGVNIEITPEGCRGIIIDFVRNTNIEFNIPDACPFTNLNNSNTIYLQPSLAPTNVPIVTSHPSSNPTAYPSLIPSVTPSINPSLNPTFSPLLSLSSTSDAATPSPTSSRGIVLFGVHFGDITILIVVIVLIVILLCFIIIVCCLIIMLRKRNQVANKVDNLSHLLHRYTTTTESLKTPLLSNLTSPRSRSQQRVIVEQTGNVKDILSQLELELQNAHSDELNITHQVVNLNDVMMNMNDSDGAGINYNYKRQDGKPQQHHRIIITTASMASSKKNSSVVNGIGDNIDAEEEEKASELVDINEQKVNQRDHNNNNDNNNYKNDNMDIDNVNNNTIAIANKHRHKYKNRDEIAKEQNDKYAPLAKPAGDVGGEFSLTVPSHSGADDDKNDDDDRYKDELSTSMSVSNTYHPFDSDDLYGYHDDTDINREGHVALPQTLTALRTDTDVIAGELDTDNPNVTNMKRSSDVMINASDNGSKGSPATTNKGKRTHGRELNGGNVPQTLKDQTSTRTKKSNR